MIDFLVIGGGIAGVSAGARLAELGSVLVLEREARLAHHASGRSAALFEQSYGRPAVVALNAASFEHHRSARGGVLRERGFLLVAGPDEEDAFAADIAQMHLREITPGEAASLFGLLDPDTVARAAYSAEAWDIDTDKLLQDFVRDLLAAGGSVRTGAKVTAIRRTDAGWAIEAGETLEARHLVDAAGAWADGIAAMAGIAPLGLQPHRRSMARIALPEGTDPAPWPMVFGAGESWYAKPDAGALIVSPAEEDPMDPHDAFADDMVLAEGLARYQAHMTAPVTRMLANWAGLRTFAPDRQLVLGPDPGDPGFVWCAGQGGYGMQSAPAASRLLADLVAGRPPELDPGSVASLTPGRLR